MLREYVYIASFWFTMKGGLALRLLHTTYKMGRSTSHHHESEYVARTSARPRDWGHLIYRESTNDEKRFVLWNRF